MQTWNIDAKDLAVRAPELRTGDRVNATAACRILGGGGHAAAAGCTVEASWAEAKRRILEAVAQVAPDFER